MACRSCCCNATGRAICSTRAQVPYRANVFALKQLGATHVLASGAVGSLREEYRPRDLVIPDSTIDKTHGRAKTFYEKAAVHVEFADPFCPVLRSLLLESASPGLRITKSHDGGCYVCMEGPAFSTRAESHMHRLMGRRRDRHDAAAGGEAGEGGGAAVCRRLPRDRLRLLAAAG